LSYYLVFVQENGWKFDRNYEKWIYVDFVWNNPGILRAENWQKLGLSLGRNGDL